MIFISFNKPLTRFAVSDLCRLLLLPVFFLSCLHLKAQAQTVNIIPYPQSVVKSDGQFILNNSALIGMNDPSVLPQVNYLQTQLQKSGNLTIAVDQDETKATIDLRIIHATQLPGAYTLTITPQKITIAASDSEGIFYGIGSLIQLVKAQPTSNGVTLAALAITDAPRYQWRGFMLDESRHFFGKEKVKQLLDWMAFYKLNKFHWHLTDVNGWRIEIKKYPKLTSV
jgi:hexosaminidase